MPLLYHIGNSDILGDSIFDRKLSASLDLIKPFSETHVRQICGSDSHVNFLLNGGSVYSAGLNSHGQLGRVGVSATNVPGVIPKLSVFTISEVAAGNDHNLALDYTGQVFSWGCNDCGQLGRGPDLTDEETYAPKLLKSIASKVIVNVSCGKKHCIALSNVGEVLTWGTNSNGQLGLGDQVTFVDRPKIVKSLSGIPVNSVVAGGEHTCVLTFSGALFSFGSNRYGQCGVINKANGSRAVNGNNDLFWPTLCRSLRSQRIKYVSAGNHHTAALTADGGLFTFGSNSAGQLGHGSSSSESLPRKVPELMGSEVVQVSCGSEHTVVLLAGGTRLMGFGLMSAAVSSSCQKETEEITKPHTPPSTVSYSSPVILGGPWNKSSSRASNVSEGETSTNTSTYRDTSPDKQLKILEIFACGRSTFLFAAVYSTSLPQKAAKTSASSSSFAAATLAATEGNISVVVCDHRQSPSRIIHLDIDSISKYCAFLPSTMAVQEVQRVSNSTSPATTTSSSSAQSSAGGMSQGILDSLSPAASAAHRSFSIPADITDELEQIFSNVACLNCSFLLQGDGHYGCGSSNHGLDLKLAIEQFARLYQQNPNVSELVTRIISTRLLTSLSPRPPDAEVLRVYLLLPMLESFLDPHLCTQIQCPLAYCITQLTPAALKLIEKWFGLLSPSIFGRFIKIYKSCVAHLLMREKSSDPFENAVREKSIYQSMELLKRINRVNEQQTPHPIVPFHHFYISELKDKIDIEADYINWLKSTFAPGTVSFCNYPFVFDAMAKTVLLQSDALLSKQLAVQTAHERNIRHMFGATAEFFPNVGGSPDGGGMVSPVLILFISRPNIVLDTLQQIDKQKLADYKKPLKVIFAGEEADDEGGVRKEFFLLLIKEIVNPQYGMFKSYDESRLLWFAEEPFESEKMFELIGILCGLAIYNNVIIYLPFPTALFKKLLRHTVTIEDLRELDPTLGKSLQEILDYEESDFQELFCLTFQVTREIFGETRTSSLYKNTDGGEIPVTQANKKEYVECYVDFVFNSSVSSQFSSFAKGFYKVCNSRVMELFHPRELQSLVVGNEDYDWQLFQKNCEYKGVFYAKHPVILMFWEVFKDLSLAQKKQFLLFLTGSDRIPILGMKAIKFYIQPSVESDKYLPAAHTCFNVLDLPQYSNIDVLRAKLLTAIQHSQGFGLV